MLRMRYSEDWRFDMTCTFGSTDDGRRFIACRRFEPRPRIGYEVPPAVTKRSPWSPGATVEHVRYGRGTITKRNSDAIDVTFAAGHRGTFMLAFIGDRMAVLP